MGLLVFNCTVSTLSSKSSLQLPGRAPACKPLKDEVLIEMQTVSVFCSPLLLVIPCIKELDERGTADILTDKERIITRFQNIRRLGNQVFVIIGKNCIDPGKLKEFTVPEADFNCETGEFVSKTYTLPFVLYKNKPERLILTPFDIVRETRMAINRRDFINNYSDILGTIDNDELRVYVNGMLEDAVKRYLEKRTAKKKPTERTLDKIRMNEFSSLARSSKPILYDYYIRMQENNSTEILQQGMSEFEKADELYLQNAEKLTSGLQAIEGLSGKVDYAQSSGIVFLKGIKDLIERDGYKDYLAKDEGPVQKQSEIDQFFNMVFCNVFGRSLFAKIKPEIEIKKAKLFEGSHYLKNKGTNNLLALLCLNPEDEKSVHASIESKNLNGEIGNSIFLITCY